ncbi:MULTISPECIES: hypothetical protein [Streptomyces]|uniref:hypothetical protein n=1 Tax=Streptomyces TaxID=1883 RepID=UPI001368AA66|nr:hypothetical protein [Streptomyces sp. SID685]
MSLRQGVFRGAPPPLTLGREASEKAQATITARAEAVEANRYEVEQTVKKAARHARFAVGLGRCDDQQADDFAAGALVLAVAEVAELADQVPVGASVPPQGRDRQVVVRLVTTNRKGPNMGWVVAAAAIYAVGYPASLPGTSSGGQATQRSEY